MDRGGAGSHWLADAVRRTGLANADSVRFQHGISNSDAWLGVAAHCGIDVEAVVQEVADQLRLPVARLDRRDPHVAKLVPEKLARRFHVVPLRESDRQIVVA